MLHEIMQLHVHVVECLYLVYHLEHLVFFHDSILSCNILKYSQCDIACFVVNPFNWKFEIPRLSATHILSIVRNLFTVYSVYG